MAILIPLLEIFLNVLMASGLRTPSLSETNSECKKTSLVPENAIVPPQSNKIYLTPFELAIYSNIMGNIYTDNKIVDKSVIILKWV